MFCWLSNYSHRELCRISFFDLVPLPDQGRLRGLIEELGQLCSSSEVQICAKSFKQKIFPKNSVLDVFLTFSHCGTLANGVKGFTCSVLPLIYTSQSESSLYLIDKNEKFICVPEHECRSSNVDCGLQFALAHFSGHRTLDNSSSGEYVKSSMLSSSRLGDGRDESSTCLHVKTSSSTRHWGSEPVSAGSGDDNFPIIPDAVVTTSWPTTQFSSESFDIFVENRFATLSDNDSPFRG